MKQSNRVKAFLGEVEDVCRMYGFSIEHEDVEGAFIVTDRRSNEDGEWLLSAHDETSGADKETIDELKTKVNLLEATLATVRNDYVTVLDKLREKEKAESDDDIPF